MVQVLEGYPAPGKPGVTYALTMKKSKMYRDSLAKNIYNLLFEWLIGQCSKVIHTGCPLHTLAAQHMSGVPPRCSKRTCLKCPRRISWEFSIFSDLNTFWTMIWLRLTRCSALSVRRCWVGAVYGDAGWALGGVKWVAWWC